MSGYDFQRDLKDSAVIIATAMRRLLTCLRQQTPGACDVAVRAASHSAKAVLGYYLPGLDRRPLVGAQVWQCVLEQLISAHEAHPRREDLGRGFKVLRPLHLRVHVDRDPLLFTHLSLQGQRLADQGRPAVASIAAARRGRACMRSGPCYRGCTVTVIRPNGHPAWHGVPKRWQELVDAELVPNDSPWRGIPSNAQLCSPCYLMIGRQLRKLLKSLPSSTARQTAAPIAPAQVPGRNARRGNKRTITAEVLEQLTAHSAADSNADEKRPKRRKKNAKEAAARPVQFGGSRGSGLPRAASDGAP